MPNTLAAASKRKNIRLKALFKIMPKKYHEWRTEAAQINAAAEAAGKEPPIPDYAQLRLKPLARQVLQARLSHYQDGADENPQRPG